MDNGHSRHPFNCNCKTLNIFQIFTTEKERFQDQNKKNFEQIKESLDIIIILTKNEELFVEQNRIELD